MPEPAVSQKTFDNFVRQYNIDMRGDMVSSNGRRGMVNDVRETRKYQSDYPSLKWLFVHRPIKTVTTIVGTYILLSTLTAVGLLNLLASMAGLKLPAP